jgi:hypothetical protein
MARPVCECWNGFFARGVPRRIGRRPRVQFHLFHVCIHHLGGREDYDVWASSGDEARRLAEEQARRHGYSMTASECWRCHEH